jgi:hypothetical protein
MDRHIVLACAFAAGLLGGACGALPARAAEPNDGAAGSTAPSKAASMKEPHDTKYDSGDTLSARPDRVDPAGKKSSTETDTTDRERFKAATSKGPTGPEPKPR